jgi:hypothetical protein
VANWKRLIVGDAFTLPSRDLNYYRDLFLLWPFLLFTLAGFAGLFDRDHNYRAAVVLLSLSAVPILLARERFVLLGERLDFVQCSHRYRSLLPTTGPDW